MKTKPALLLLSLPLSTVLAENPARPGPAPAAQVTPATRLTPGAILAAQIREISGTKDLSHASKIRQIASAARLALTTTLTNVKDPEQAVRLALDLAADAGLAEPDFADLIIDTITTAAKSIPIFSGRADLGELVRKNVAAAVKAALAAAPGGEAAGAEAAPPSRPAAPEFGGSTDAVVVSPSH